MENETDIEQLASEFVDAPVAAQLTVVRDTGYGSVPGLDDEELLDEQELERCVFWEEWGPILTLPVRKRSSVLRPSSDENGRADWGAFGTVDFERMYGPFDKVRYKTQMLREKLRDVLITLDIVKQRVPPSGFLVLKLVQMGILDEEHVTSDDVRALLRLRRRVQGLRDEITALTAARQRRQEVALERALARLVPG